MNGYFDLEQATDEPRAINHNEVDINTSNSDGKGILDKECPTNGIDGPEASAHPQVIPPYEKDQGGTKRP